MDNVRETYDLPERPPVPMRQWLLMLAVPLIALVLWLVLPDSPIVVAILVLVVLVTVFLGVQRILRARQLSTPPGRNPTTPPSAQSHT
jgi:hypothetical protein